MADIFYTSLSTNRTNCPSERVTTICLLIVHSRTERVQYAVAMPDNILETPVPVATDAKLLKCTSANCHGSQGRYFAQSYQPSGCWFVQISVDEHFSRIEEAGNKDDLTVQINGRTELVCWYPIQPEDYEN